METEIMSLWQFFLWLRNNTRPLHLTSGSKIKNATKNITFPDKAWLDWAKQTRFLESASQNWKENDAGKCFFSFYFELDEHQPKDVNIFTSCHFWVKKRFKTDQSDTYDTKSCGVS